MERAKCEKDIIRNRNRTKLHDLNAGSNGYENIIDSLSRTNDDIINSLSSSTCGLLVSDDEANII